MFQYSDRSERLEQKPADQGEHALEASQLAAFEEILTIAAYIDTLPNGLIADEI